MSTHFGRLVKKKSIFSCLNQDLQTSLILVGGQMFFNRPQPQRGDMCVETRYPPRSKPQRGGICRVSCNQIPEKTPKLTYRSFIRNPTYIYQAELIPAMFSIRKLKNRKKFTHIFRNIIINPVSVNTKKLTPILKL